MHCPRCGQEQISSEVAFCKTCGFSLGEVKELLATDGISLARERQSHKKLQSPRRKGVRHGIMLLFISMVFLPFIELIGKPQGNFLPMIFLMGGLMRILYAVIFQEGAPRKKKQQDSSLSFVAPITTDQLGKETRRFALPSSDSVAVSVLSGRRRDTAEMISRPSVTEHTTKLLDESADQK